MVTSKQLRLAVEMEEKEEQDRRMIGDGQREKSKTGEDGSIQTAQVGHGDGGKIDLI